MIILVDWVMTPRTGVIFQESSYLDLFFFFFLFLKKKNLIFLIQKRQSLKRYMLIVTIIIIYFIYDNKASCRVGSLIVK